MGLIAVGIFLCMMRWISLYKFYKTGHISSQAPFIGGILICIGFYITTPLKNFWCLGILIDSSLSWEWLLLFFKKFINK
jgi:hypothetical protein